MRYLVHHNGRQEEDRVIRTKEGREMVLGEMLPIPEPEQLEPAPGFYLVRVVNDPRVTESGVHIPETARDPRKDFMRVRVVKVGPPKGEKRPLYEKGMILMTSQAAGLMVGMDNYKPLILLIAEDAIIGHVDYGPGLQ